MSVEEKLEALDKAMSLLDEAKAVSCDVTDHPFVSVVKQTPSNYPWEPDDELELGLASAWLAAYKLKCKLKGEANG